MRGRSASRRSSSRPGWQSTKPDPSKIGPLLRRAGFVGSESDPTMVKASFDDDGRPRRIHARYADGWTCTMHLGRDGAYSLTQSIRMRVKGRARGLEPGEGC